MATYVDWLIAHQAYFWLALALACNAWRRLRTDTQIVASVERTRAGAAGAAALRFFGLDPIGAVQILAALLNAKATVEAARGHVAVPEIIPPTLRPGFPPGGSEGSGDAAEGQDPRGVSL